MNSKKVNIGKNIVLSIGAQIVSFLCGVVLQLIIPKFIDELQYSFWQTFVLYVGYVGILHFGLLDGMVLRYSQYDYEELDRKRIHSIFTVLLIATTLMCFSGIVVGLTFFTGSNQIIFVLVSIGIITKNIFTYTSYTFQITNRINKYAVLVIVQRSVYAVVVLLMLLFKKLDFYWFCVAELIGDIVGIVLGMLFNKGLYLGNVLPSTEIFKELWANISAGILLLMANWSAMLFIGGAKMIIQWKWGDLLFGKVSFAFSVSNLFLTFVTAISVVLFPSLKRMSQSELPGLYKRIRGAIYPILFIALIFYYPGSIIIETWLPNYKESLNFLGILLPIIVYLTTVSLLTNNYLKAYRKELAMLIVNIVSIVLAFILYITFAYLVQSLMGVLLSVVIAVAIRAVLSEIIVSKIVNIKLLFEFIIEGMMVALFIVSTQFFEPLMGFFIYAASVIIYIFIKRKELILLLKSIVRRKQ